MSIKRHFESGLAFIVVALICFAAGIMGMINEDASQGGVFLGSGAVWIVIAIAVRRKSQENR